MIQILKKLKNKIFQFIKLSFNEKKYEFRSLGEINPGKSHIHIKNIFNQLRVDDEFMSNALDNRYGFYGDKIYSFGEDSINWFYDPISSFDYSLYDGKRISELFNKKIDIKVLWRLARLQHLPLIATRHPSDKNLNYILKTLNSFDSENKSYSGIHWSSGMEISIRAMNLYATYILIYKNLSNEERLFISKLIYKHLFFLKNNIEYGSDRGNHYLINILVLDFLETEIFESKNIILNFLIKCELKYQFNKDGSHFEGSTNYTRLCYDAYLLNKLSHKTKSTITFSIPFSGIDFVHALIDIPRFFYKKYEEKRTFNFLLDNVSSSNEFIPIGDNDSGYIFTNKFIGNINQKKYFFDDIQVSKLIRNEVFNTNHIEQTNKLIRSKDFKNIRYRKFDDIVDKDIGEFNFSLPLSSRLKEYKDFGLFVLKSNDAYLSIKYNSSSRNSGHFHYDSLSMNLCFDGKFLLVDPGTETYTTSIKLRNYSRSGILHQSTSLLKNTKFFSSFKAKKTKVRRTKNSTKFIGHKDSIYKSIQIVRTTSSFDIKGTINRDNFKIWKELYPKHIIFQTYGLRAYLDEI